MGCFSPSPYRHQIGRFEREYPLVLLVDGLFFQDSVRCCIYFCMLLEVLKEQCTGDRRIKRNLNAQTKNTNNKNMYEGKEQQQDTAAKTNTKKQ